MIGKIALVANTAWYVWNFRAALIERLQREGYEVVVLAPYDKYADRLIAAGIEYRSIKINNKGTNPFEDLALMRRLYACLARERPDFILTYTIKPNIYGSMVARWLRTPVINNVSGLGTVFIGDSSVDRLVKAMYRYAFGRSATVFFQNDDDLRMFVNAGLASGAAAERIPGSGVDTRKFVPDAVQTDRGDFTFVLPARLLWDKGVGEFVEAARALRERYPRARFQLLGFLGVNNRSAISALQVRQWEDEGIVRYLGASDDMAAALQSADCVVLPSYYREGVPRSLLEAASCAKPIITTRSVGCREVVDDGVNGFLCEPRDAGDLADKMARMLSLSDDERATMGVRGREKMIRDFDERIVIERYLVAIREALSRKARPRVAAETA